MQEFNFFMENTRKQFLFRVQMSYWQNNDTWKLEKDSVELNLILAQENRIIES